MNGAGSRERRCYSAPAFLDSLRVPCPCSPWGSPLSVRRAHRRGQQAQHPPQDSADVPASRPDHDGASACPAQLAPQQATVASLRTPHECPPADTAVNEPDGASASPVQLAPQQATVPFVRSPHE